MLRAKASGGIQPPLEILHTFGEPESLQHDRSARPLAHEGEIARVRNQHEAVAVPVAAHLLTLRREPGVIVCGPFTSTTPRSGVWPSRGLALLYLLRRVEAEIGWPAP